MLYIISLCKYSVFFITLFIYEYFMCNKAYCNLSAAN